jgi:hypothetical protein
MTEEITPANPSQTEKKVVSEVEVPEFAPAAKKEEVVEEKKEEVAPVEVPPQEEDEQAILQKRLKGAITEVEKKNDEVRRVVELQVDLVKDNPELIHKIATSDPVLANKVILKVWGAEGIRSYKQLMERAKIEELKATDPTLYETKSEMMRIKAQLEAQRIKEQEKAKKAFLASKKILENEYDPKYKKLQEAMDNLNPALVTEDYEKALGMAHTIAFGGKVVEGTEVELPRLAPIGTGTRPAPLPKEKGGYSEQTTWLAKALEEKRGYKNIL